MMDYGFFAEFEFRHAIQKGEARPGWDRNEIDKKIEAKRRENAARSQDQKRRDLRAMWITLTTEN